MIHYDNVSFRYEPWPIAVARNLFSADFYDELSRTFPSLSLFESDPGLGTRFSFDRHRGGRAFDEFFKTNPAWRELRKYVESRDFLLRTVTMLASHRVELCDMRAEASLGERMLQFARRVKRGSLARLRVELILVILPADGGALFPHTDAPAKFVNFAVSMMRPGEWDPAFGGSTDIVWPKDPRKIVSLGTERLAFDEVQILDRISYAPNQAVIVVKTASSWHSVGPMECQGSTALRKTLNINVLHS